MSCPNNPGEKNVFNVQYEFRLSSVGEERRKHASTGRRIIREDGLEALEYIEEDDPQEIKVAKRLQGATESPKTRIFHNGKEVSEGYKY